MKKQTNIDVDAAIQALEIRRAQLVKLRELQTAVRTMERLSVCMTKEINTLFLVADVVSDDFGVTMEGLLSPVRTEVLVIPRHLIFYICHEVHGLTLEKIAQHFKRDHGTVIHGCRANKARMDTLHGFADKVAAIVLKIEGVLKEASELKLAKSVRQGEKKAGIVINNRVRKWEGEEVTA